MPLQKKYDSIKSNARHLLSDLMLRFLRRDSGTVAMTFGICLIPIAIAAGIAVDLNQALVVRQRLSQAVDAAALASGATINMSEAARDAYIMNYMAANYTDDEIGQITSITATNTDGAVTILATATLETTLLGIIGYDTLTVGASTVVLRELTGLELVMVLDNTGSMSGSKITALRAAATELVNILYGDEVAPEKLRIGLVPFAAAVNIGTGALAAGWMDQLGQAPSAQAKFNFNPGQTVWDLYNAIPNRSWNGCVETRLPPYDTTDDPPTSPATRWQPYFAPDERSSTGYDNSYFSDGVSGTTDVRQKHVGKYNGTSVSSSSNGPLFGCTVAPLTPLTNNKSVITSAINAMGADGYTHIPVGLAWGWRVISPNAPFTEGVSYTDPSWEKAIILLTDGENTIDAESNDNRSNYSAYGHLVKGRLGTTNAATFEGILNNNTALVCQNIKDAGIRVYTITFQVNTSTVQNLMRNCASEPGLYFNSPSNSELQAAFQAIGSDLNNLRISQ